MYGNLLHRGVLRVFVENSKANVIAATACVYVSQNSIWDNTLTHMHALSI